MQIPVWAIIVAAVVLLVIALLVVRWGIKQYRRNQLSEQIQQRPEDSVRYAFVINPSKPGAEKITERIRNFCSTHSISKPLIIETQLDKNGYVCAKEALNKGADVVVAVGGDGTVRTVASALAGTNHAFAIVPIGTANLFARNMNIPLYDVEGALKVAISHGSRRVDVGRMALLDSKEPEHRHGFLIIAGVGFDAQMIDETDPNMKKNLGWMAYFFSGVKNLFSKKTRGHITIERADGTTATSKDVTFRTFMAGNCGQIPGFSLMPEANYSDGLLDFELLDTDGGIIGWANLFGDVVHQTVTRKSGQSPLSTNSTMEQTQGVRAEVVLDKPTLTEVDGDILGESKHVELSVEKRSLLVRVPTEQDLSETATIPPIKV